MEERHLRTAQLLGQAGVQRLQKAHVAVFGLGGVGGYAAEDYVLDAVDTVAAKLELAVRAHAAGVPIASAMGCGNKLDPTAFTVTDIFATHTDPLARVLRRELKKRGVPRLKVVYSTEAARTPCLPGEEKGTAGRPAPASVSFVPGVAGLILAGEAIKDLSGVR